MDLLIVSLNLLSYLIQLTKVPKINQDPLKFLDTNNLDQKNSAPNFFCEILQIICFYLF